MGIAPIKNGHNTRQRNRPARQNRQTVKLETTMLSTSAVGRITAGSTPDNPISAR
jgi:hypothetical protein